MDKKFSTVKWGSAIAALVNGAVYVFALSLALGETRLAIPGVLSSGWAAVQVILSLTFIGAWLVEHGTEVTTRRVVVPVIEQAIRDAMEANTPAVARGVAAVVTSGLDLKLTSAAYRGSARAAALLRAELSGDITDIVQAGLNRAQVYGMTRQAMAQSATSGNVRQLREVSPGD